MHFGFTGRETEMRSDEHTLDHPEHRDGYSSVITDPDSDPLVSLRNPERTSPYVGNHRGDDTREPLCLHLNAFAVVRLSWLGQAAPITTPTNTADEPSVIGPRT